MKQTSGLPLLFLIAAFSCTKEKYKQKPYVGPAESLLNGYVQANPSVTIKESTALDIPYEYGIVFTSSKKGYISGVGSRMPVLGGVYTISLWDYETAQLIKRFEVANIINSGFNYIDMEAIGQAVNIAPNKKYMVSIYVKATSQSQPWPYYYMLKPSSVGSAADYIPFTVGSLTCLGTQFTIAFPSSFPGQPVLHKDIINGLCDINFRPTEK